MLDGVSHDDGGVERRGRRIHETGQIQDGGTWFLCSALGPNNVRTLTHQFQSIYTDDFLIIIRSV